MTSGPARALASLIFAAASGAGPFALAAPPPSLALAARTVVADAACPVPAKGALYVFTERALTRAELAEFDRAGLAYLGVAGQHAYAFVVVAGEPAELSRRLLRSPAVLGCAAAEPQDKLRSDLLDALDVQAPRAALPYPLALTLWPKTPAHEARALLPEATEDMRWPAADAAPVELEHSVYLSKAASTVDRLARLLRSPYVASIGFDAPRKSFNEGSRVQSNSDLIFDQPYALDGTGVLVGHWDGGEVDERHPDLAGRVENLDSDAVSRHATHTAGTIMGSGFGDPEARGHAPGATLVARTFRGNAPAERRATKHSHYHEHDNHSWGQDPDTVGNFGTYNQVGYELDVDGRDLLMLAVKAAGNEGRESEIIVERTGFDSLSPDSTSKNALVVGATDDRGRLAIFSSRGPTEDGRIKPDVCAVGAGVRSTVPGGGYGTSSGTSMSTPGVSGMLALLSQLHTREQGLRWAPDLIRGLMIHTARDAWNRGPDYRYGWGLADAQAAADLIVADAQALGRHLVRGAVREGEALEWPLEVPEGREELKVTLTWLDAFANPSGQRLLIHDLDLELIAPDGEVFYPWSLDPSRPLEDATQDAPNAVDNVEQVLVTAPAPGAWTARVRAASVTDPTLPVQGFVLVSDLPVERHTFRFGAVFDASRPRTLPDGDPAGRAAAFEVPDLGEVLSLRVYAEIEHDARGDLRILLEGPDGTRVTLETEDESSRRDIYAIYPDTRSYDDDVTALYGQSSYGTWTVYVIDTQRSETGSIRDLVLEIDTDGEINEPPVAVARADDPVESEATGRLFGEDSTDPEGRPLTYAWTQLDGPAVTLDGADAATASYVAPRVAAEVPLTFQLTVDDGRGATDTATVTVTVLPPNERPIANAGEDQQVQAGLTFELNGLASTDPDVDDALSFSWAQIGGPALPDADLEGAVVTLTAPAPAPAEPLVFELTVSDGRAQATDTVTVTVTDEPPRSLDEGDGCGCTATHRGAGGPWGLLLLLGVWALRRR